MVVSEEEFCEFSKILPMHVRNFYLFPHASHIATSLYQQICTYLHIPLPFLSLEKLSLFHLCLPLLSGHNGERKLSGLVEDRIVLQNQHQEHPVPVQPRLYI